MCIAILRCVVGCMFLTRTTTLLLGTFFVFELVRASYMKRSPPLPSEGPLGDRIRKTVAGADRRVLLAGIALFTAPLLLCLAIATYSNYERFHDPRPWAFGHEFLTVGWQGRIRKAHENGSDLRAARRRVPIGLRRWPAQKHLQVFRRSVRIELDINPGSQVAGIIREGLIGSARAAVELQEHVTELTAKLGQAATWGGLKVRFDPQQIRKRCVGQVFR